MSLYHSPRGLHPFQVEGIARWALTKGIFCTWDTGCGKALRNDQRVATPKGWRQIDSLSVGDEVLGVDGRPCRVTGVYPQGERPLWRVTFSDGQSVICDDEHLWSVHTRSAKWKGSPPRVLTTREIREGDLTLPNGERRFFIPMAEPVQHDEVPLPIDPYTLGALLGDGGLTQSPRITTMDEDLISHLVLPDGVEVKPRPSTGSRARCYMLVSPRGQENTLLTALRAMGCCVRSWEKHIPEPYLHASIEQRWALLQGLLDTDGSCGGSIEFYTTSPALADDVRELVQSLGGTAKVFEMIKSYPYLGETRVGRTAYRMSLVLPNDRCPFRIRRKVAAWRPRRNPTRAIISIESVDSAEATCIAVDGPQNLYLTEGYVVTHNSHLVMGGGAFLIEEGLIEHMLVVCEQGKVPEWVPDFEEFTSLRVVRYGGAPKRRAKIRESLGTPDGPQVLVGTYETFRNDIGSFQKGSGRKKWVEGPLMDALRPLAPQGIAVAYDESTRLGGRFQAAGVTSGGRWQPQRGSVVYKAHEHLLSELRAASGGNLWVAALTGTPIEASPETAFNQFRLVAPDLAGTVADFERDHVLYRDAFGRTDYKNIGPGSFHSEAWVVSLAEKMAPVLSTKRKTDPDVAAAFPEATEEPIFVPLSADHKRLYDAVDALRNDPEVFPPEDYPDGPSERDEDVLFGLLRLVAAHPMAVAHSTAAQEEGTLANYVVSKVGVEALSRIRCAKEEVLVQRMRSLVHDQGDQVVIFTFYGGSVLPLLEKRLVAEGHSVSTYHGEMSRPQRERAMDDFRSGRTRILLCSDAGARGLNIPEARYVVSYELCLTHAKTLQRINRISRMGSGHASITALSMVAEGTVEEQILGLNFRRQEWHEDLLDLGEDTADSLSVESRRALFDGVRGKSPLSVEA